MHGTYSAHRQMLIHKGKITKTIMKVNITGGCTVGGVGQVAANSKKTTQDQWRKMVVNGKVDGHLAANFDNKGLFHEVFARWNSGGRVNDLPSNCKAQQNRNPKA